MKFLASLLSLLLVLTYIVRVPALAASATFSTDSAGHGAVQGQASVNKIGALLLADATAFLSSTTIEVKSNNSSSGNNQPLLSGQILQAKQSGGHIHGIAFFQGGSSLAQLCTKGGVERIATSGGDVLEGTIGAVTADGIDITLANGLTRHVDGGQLKCVDSGCAFEFDMAANSSKMTFSHCTLPHTVQVKQTSARTQVSSDGVSRTRKIILTCVILTAIAVAIAVPIAVGVSSHHHHHNHNEQQTELNNLLLLRSRQSSSPSSFSSFSSFP